MVIFSNELSLSQDPLAHGALILRRDTTLHYALFVVGVPYMLAVAALPLAMRVCPGSGGILLRAAYMAPAEAVRRSSLAAGRPPRDVVTPEKS